MLTNDEDFQRWLAQWDKAEKELAAEITNVPKIEDTPLRTSFFNNAPSDKDYTASTSGPTDDWNALYHRAAQLDFTKGDNLITDAVNVTYDGNQGYGKEYVPTVNEKDGGKKAYTNNPIHFASQGEDQTGDDGHVRVTDNWSDGNELKELAEVKRKLEVIERKFHEADILKKKDRTKLENELKDLRSKVKKLSEKMVSNPKTDLT